LSTIISDNVRKFLESQTVGTIATRRKSGKIRQTLVYYIVDGDRILISTESKRLKSRDVNREKWASFCVFGHAKPYPAVTVEGAARIMTKGIGEYTANLVTKIRGQRPTQVPTDAILAAADRVILEITIEHVYSVMYLDSDSA